MTKRTRIILVGAGVVAVLGGGAGIAVAGGAVGDDDEAPIEGPALARASAAALEHTGGGRVTETEVGDEESYYEVEVTLDDGHQVDVQLDQEFNVVSTETEGRDEDENQTDD